MKPSIAALGATVMLVQLVSRSGHAQTADPSDTVAARTPSHATKGAPIWEIGARVQTSILDTQVGLDLGLRPTKYIGLGMMMGYALRSDFNSHCSDTCRDAHWWWFTPYVEGRLAPDHHVSPYGRIGVGLASGSFTHWRDDSSPTVASAHSELGVDFHAFPNGISFRLFVGLEASPSNKSVRGDLFGLPGVGAQLGTAL